MLMVTEKRALHVIDDPVFSPLRVKCLLERQAAQFLGGVLVGLLIGVVIEEAYDFWRQFLWLRQADHALG